MEGRASSHWIIHAPAFAEEMNKSRHMVARQARRFAARGHTVVVPDLCGTGDSPSSFEDATWEGWIDELCRIVEWARGQGAERVSLWGLRLGCLLAVAAAARLSEEGRAPSHLLFWQPLLAGKVQMAQFLRLVTAASITGVGNQASAAETKAALVSGESVEVAGYPLSSALYTGLFPAEASTLNLSEGTVISVFEVVSEPDKPMLPVTARQLEAWQAQGLCCHAGTVVGDPFWTTQELGFADALLAASDEAMAPFAVSGPEPTISASAHTRLKLSGTAEESIAASPLVFSCQRAQLSGFLHRPLGDVPQSTGVLIVVGGPQYRVGSHRQFVFLAEALAQAGYPVLRFDYRGMGDSDGELTGFTAIHEDIAAAVSVLQEREPSVGRVALWGLCDAATASVVYAGSDPRVQGLVLANPWVYSPGGAAAVRLKRYYLQRVLSPDFWKKLFSGGVRPIQSMLEILQSMRRAFVKRKPTSSARVATSSRRIDDARLVDEFAAGLTSFSGKSLIILSENDFTAQEFEQACRTAPLLSSVHRTGVLIRALRGADHTFSRSQDHDQVISETLDFLGYL
jgi:exosortase A-associated hydrolase 1/exosortase A-associated hydrolase 2